MLHKMPIPSLRGSMHIEKNASPKRPAQITARTVVIMTLSVCALSVIRAAFPVHAIATERPNIEEKLRALELHATRAYIEAYALLSNVSLPKVKWRCEYAPAAEDGLEPKSPASPGEPPWKLANEEETEASSLSMTCGELDAPVAARILHHLTPKTKYFARFTVEEGQESASRSFGFETHPVEAPEVALDIFGEPTLRLEVNSPTSATAEAQIESNGSETPYSFEYAEREGGPWTIFSPGGSTVTTSEDFSVVKLEVAGLLPKTTYFVRIGINHMGEKTFFQHEALNDPAGRIVTLTDHPVVSVREAEGTSAHSGRVDGEIVPHHMETRWRYEYAPAENSGPPAPNSTSWTSVNAPEGVISLEKAEKLPEGTAEKVGGPITGLAESTTYWVRMSAESAAGEGEVCYTELVREPPLCESALSSKRGWLSLVTFGPPAGVTLGTHAFDGKSVRLLGSVDSNGTAGVGYFFEYVGDRQFRESGFVSAVKTPVVSLGSSSVESVIVGQDLPALIAGGRYHYRVVVTSPGNQDNIGNEQTLIAPSEPEGAQVRCPNDAARTGDSAGLPDCRAYEQVTPVDKEGAQEIFRYDGLKVPAFALVGEDGNHMMLEAQAVKWGSGPNSGTSPYFFARGPGGWSVSAGTIQPEAGIDQYTPQVLNSDASMVGMEAGWELITKSPNVEYKAGPGGGPYVSVATVPRVQVGSGGGWVAASSGFSKLVLQVEDHGLVKPATKTKSGFDLYEYSGGALRQVNVGGDVGTCGARIVRGNEGGNETVGLGRGASPHAVSADGSRIFFEAVPVPGENCNEPAHVYERINGAETLDLLAKAQPGVYRFVAADSEGADVLLEKTVGENAGLYLSKSGGSPKLLASTGQAVGIKFNVSEDLKEIYFFAGGSITRYDVASETAEYVASVDETKLRPDISQNGRYLYFNSLGVDGVPGGATVPGGGHKEEGHPGPLGPTMQVYRYDSVERVIQCISCASPTDPEPKLSANFSDGAAGVSPSGMPRLTFASDNGEFAFFETAADLIPADVDGEVIPEGDLGFGQTKPEHASDENSVSGDVYEWRRAGSDGCTAPQGCLALITDGRGGYLNEMIGTAEEGRDVFIYTSSQLLKQDNDTAGDIYDARIGGGFVEPAGVVECEGDSCATPFVPPSEVTPSSSAFQSAGNKGVTIGGMERKPPLPKCKGKHRTKKYCRAKRKKRVEARKRRTVKPKPRKRG